MTKTRLPFQTHQTKVDLFVWSVSCHRTLQSAVELSNPAIWNHSRQEPPLVRTRQCTRLHSCQSATDNKNSISNVQKHLQCLNGHSLSTAFATHLSNLFTFHTYQSLITSSIPVFLNLCENAARSTLFSYDEGPVPTDLLVSTFPIFSFKFIH